FISQEDDNQLLVKKVEMIPIKVMLWNFAAQSLAKRLGLKEGTELESPVLELYLKNSKLKEPMINDYHAFALGLCDRSEMSAIVRITTKINAVLKSYFARKNLQLLKFQLEFGRLNNQIILADEISPDVLDLWDVSDGNKPDKKSLNVSKENAKDIYNKIKERVL
ncbi:MAG: phosphoribosylaminoimidazolesuccinocarboxamide synthase, partial [Calditrichia bacterium]